MPEEGNAQLSVPATLGPRKATWTQVDVWRLCIDPGDDARALVRSVLAGYLDAKPEALTFVHGVHGKPELESGGRLRFNISRSGSFGLLAVTRGREVGVDVEQIDPRRAVGPIADRLFDADEAAELRSLPEARRIRRFFELWTQKEAYAKALGVGLSVPLERLRPTRGWSLVDLPLGPDHVGALCVRGRRPRVRLLG